MLGAARPWAQASAHPSRTPQRAAMTKKTAKTSRSAKTRSAKQPVARSKPPPRAEVGPVVSPTAGTELFERIATILEQARTRVVRAVNTEMVLAY